MFLLHDGKPTIDYDYNVLVDLIAVVDGSLAELEDNIERCPDPDAWGLGDLGEGVCGMGFAVCHQYMTATASWCRVRKAEAVACGPVHPCGELRVSVCNTSSIVPFLSISSSSSL